MRYQAEDIWKYDIRDILEQELNDYVEALMKNLEFKEQNIPDSRWEKLKHEEGKQLKYVLTFGTNNDSRASLEDLEGEKVEMCFFVDGEQWDEDSCDLEYQEIDNTLKSFKENYLEALAEKEEELKEAKEALSSILSTHNLTTGMRQRSGDFMVTRTDIDAYEVGYQGNIDSNYRMIATFQSKIELEMVKAYG